MVIDNFIKMGPKYINWSSGITSAEVELVEMLGSGATRKVTKYKVVVKDLVDMLLFRCNGYTNIIKARGYKYTGNATPPIELDGYVVHIENNLYHVQFPLKELKMLVQLNRKDSTYNDLKNMPRCTMDIPMLAKVLNKIIRISILDFFAKPNCTEKLIGSGVVITNAFIDEANKLVYVTLDKNKVDLLIPDNKYSIKYLSDSFVLGSEYCKNFHSFISIYGDVFKSQVWKAYNKPYTYTSIEDIANAMGVRYDPNLITYDKKTHCYPRVDVVQYVKKFTKEINEKTRIPQTYGNLAYEIIRQSKTSLKVIGIRFYFEEVK